jgi:hypothetical protein
MDMRLTDDEIEGLRAALHWINGVAGRGRVWGFDHPRGGRGDVARCVSAPGDGTRGFTYVATRYPGGIRIKALGRIAFVSGADFTFPSR